jgi:lipopolysaccharide/colanic/teichoic acid biosynthesis glycosyltransferase
MDRANSGAATGVHRPLFLRQQGHSSSARWANTIPRTQQRRTIDVIRWMEALVERADRDDARRKVQDAWTAEAEGVPEVEPRAAEGERQAWPTRALNFTLALLALVSLLPVFLLLAVLIKLTSRGPVLYLQERVGLDRRLPGIGTQNRRRTHDVGGRPFTIYKFRTMRVDAEQLSGAVWAQPQDPRVTPLGRVLRQYRLDELPQLLNVLRGEMNLVGPRPERPTIFAELRGHISEYPLRQRAKPGITGLAQINHHYDRSLDDVRTKVSYDLEYIRRQSLREDLRIMLKTIPVVLLRRGGW